MTLLLCELDALLALDSASSLATLLPEGDALLERLRQVAPLRAATPSDSEAVLCHLLLPFLALHQVRADGLAAVGSSVPLAAGAAALIGALNDNGWAVQLCSDLWQPYPAAVAERLGLRAEQTFGPPYPADVLAADLGAYALASISELGDDLRLLPADDPEALTGRVARFYTDDISYSGFAGTLEAATPLLPRDWLKLAEQALADLGLSWSETAAVGSSASATPLLSAVQAGGGLAMSLDVEQARSRGFVSCIDLNELLHLLQTWKRRGLKGVRAT